MINRNEFQCIEKANKARAALAKLELEALRKEGLAADTLLREFNFSNYWQGGMLVKIIRTLFLPVGLIVLILVDVVLVGLNMWEKHIEKRRLKAEILKEKINSKKLEVPNTKTLRSLWHLHGLSERACTNEGRLQLLSEWIKILYGESIAESVNLNQRLEAIMSTHERVNRPYYEGGSEATRFFFGSPVDCLIKELSEELGEYI